MKKNLSSPTIVIGIVVILLFVWALYFVFGVLKGTTSDQVDEVEFMALVTGVTDGTANPVVMFTLVEWISGDDARVAIAKDTDCAEANAEACVESFANNGFYIRPVVEELQLPLSPTAAITFMENMEKVEREISDLQRRLETTESILFIAKYEKDIVTALNEEYLP